MSQRLELTSSTKTISHIIIQPLCSPLILIPDCGMVSPGVVDEIHCQHSCRRDHTVLSNIKASLSTALLATYLTLPRFSLKPSRWHHACQYPVTAEALPTPRTTTFLSSMMNKLWTASCNSTSSVMRAAPSGRRMINAKGAKGSPCGMDACTTWARGPVH